VFKPTTKEVPMKRRYRLDELEALPTLCVGQADNLKIEEPTRRVWLSRCTVADGEPYDNKVTVRERIEDQWLTTDVYQAVTS
jgi:hypothetical protein